MVFVVSFDFFPAPFVAFGFAVILALSHVLACFVSTFGFLLFVAFGADLVAHTVSGCLFSMFCIMNGSLEYVTGPVA